MSDWPLLSMSSANRIAVSSSAAERLMFAGRPSSSLRLASTSRRTVARACSTNSRLLFHSTSPLINSAISTPAVMVMN
jgi:hypothetical protein